MNRLARLCPIETNRNHLHIFSSPQDATNLPLASVCLVCGHLAALQSKALEFHNQFPSLVAARKTESCALPLKATEVDKQETQCLKRLAWMLQ